MSATFDVKEHTITASHIREFPRATAVSQDDTLLLHVKQYTPKDNPNPVKGDITVIGAHANGFPKELYQPLWEEFYQAAARRGIRIRDIWIADTAWQGTSGVLNQNTLGDDPGWYDYARDIVHMINTFRMPRPLLAVGHSFGGNALANASILHPRLFMGIALIEPTIAAFQTDFDAVRHGPVGMSIFRREVWPSRQAAIEGFKKSKFYQSWDPRVLDCWFKYGVRPVRQIDGDDGEGEVTLTTTKYQEVFTFVRPSWPAFDASGEKLVNPAYAPEVDRPLMPFDRTEGRKTLERLPYLRPSALFVHGGQSYLSTPEIIQEKQEKTGSGVGGSGGAKAGRVTVFTNHSYGHLIPFEAPQYCAGHVADFAEKELARWWKDEKEYEEWAKKPLAEKSRFSDEWMRRMGLEDPRAKAKSKM